MQSMLGSGELGRQEDSPGPYGRGFQTYSQGRTLFPNEDLAGTTILQ